MKSVLICSLFIAYLLVLVKGECDLSTRNKIQLSSNGGLFTSSVSGRVEICVCTSSSNDSCSWQSVSTGSTTSPISWKNSIVVCRELGYFDVYSPILQDTVQAINQADSSLDISPTMFNCDGTESSLFACTTGTSTGSLTHLADAYVNCQSSAVNEKVRLAGGSLSSDDRGVVEYYVSNSWRTICPDLWDNDDADLLCTSLGFASGTSTSYSRTSFLGPNIETTPSIQFVTCLSTANYFSQCTPSIGSTCSTFTTLAGVICQSSSTTEGTVRLFSTSSSSFYDRVEVFYDGRWGTVCRINWNSDDGDVACRELGGNVDEAVISSSTTFNSRSSLPIWVSAYRCDGDESTLSSCDTTLYPVGYVGSTCSHSTDAGLSCPMDTSTGGGGLSGGSIAGIVIGAVVFVSIMSWFFGLSNKEKRRRRAAAIRSQQAATVIRVAPSSTTSTVPSTSTSTTQQTTTTTESNPDSFSTPSNPTLSQAAPPSYNEALTHLDAKDPPQYPDEEKKVPYPVGSSNVNPAYPSAPPGPSDNLQGYPPPTQPGFGAPYPPSVDSNPYPPPPQAQMPGSALPYPT